MIEEQETIRNEANGADFSTAALLSGALGGTAFRQSSAAPAYSQPPLSASLRQLEEELKVKLLLRNSKRVTLTPAGEAFQRQARRILEQLEDSQTLVQRIASSATGLVRVGFTPAMLFRGLPELLKRLQSRYPGIEIQLIERNSADQVEAVMQEQLDIGFIHSMPLPEEIESVILSDEPFLCCLPAHHHLAGRRELAVKELANEPIILFGRDLALTITTGSSVCSTTPMLNPIFVTKSPTG
ncbi:hypothetical protein HORIV_20300 [Vreelandella olivaria]|uniref:HTH lysR-type domain-containing protein n=1 Tax=Vreelandella olivaria TaxID=390919 RepID=A0ABN5WRJ5_9GAMM|nr:hypothetical protein HORIV_20300 [Halomonas olivaria]